jgi:hypothetical protein
MGALRRAASTPRWTTEMAAPGHFGGRRSKALRTMFLRYLSTSRAGSAAPRLRAYSMCLAKLGRKSDARRLTRRAAPSAPIRANSRAVDSRRNCSSRSCRVSGGPPPCFCGTRVIGVPSRGHQDVTTIMPRRYRSIYVQVQVRAAYHYNRSTARLQPPGRPRQHERGYIQFVCPRPAGTRVASIECCNLDELGISAAASQRARVRGGRERITSRASRPPPA